MTYFMYKTLRRTIIIDRNTSSICVDSTILTTYFNDKPLYSVLFLNDDISSCYLYGSGNIEIKNRYAGSLALWKAIEQSIDKKLSFIDLEGINSPLRGEYKICFGGNIENYFNITF